MAKFTDSLKNSTNTFNGLMVIGFLGVVWLMIFGNLSTNLGFPRVSTAFYNETINLTWEGNIPTTAQGRVDGSLSGLVITNATGIGVIISTGNYSVTDVTIAAIDAAYNSTNVNVTGVVTYDSNSDIATEGVISNLTGGVQTFFSFSNVLFTIVAIVLLISLLLGLLFLVMSIVKASRGKGDSGGFAE